MADDRRHDQAPDKPTLGEGLPANVDIHKLGETDNPQLDWGDEDLGAEAAHGANHANRPRTTDIAMGQGRQTTERNREIVRGKLYK